MPLNLTPQSKLATRKLELTVTEEDPITPKTAYCRSGRHALVYRVQSKNGRYVALKVFNETFRTGEIERNAKTLHELYLLGLYVCKDRVVLTDELDAALLKEYPHLRYAVLMPWVPGRSWQDIIRERVDLKPRASLQIAKSLIEILVNMETKSLAHCDLSGANTLLPGLVLFSIDSGFAAALNEEQLTDALREAFQKQNKPLNANATVKARQAGSEWMINNAGVPYSVRNERRDLNVYHDYQPSVEIVDVEDMYLSVGQPPANLPTGTPGYSHRAAASGIWGKDADRFAGAILISEILGWCDQRVKKGAVGEQYFNTGELQTDCDRYRLLSQCLKEKWGKDVVSLLERAWNSATLDECPSFADWQNAFIALEERLPDMERELSRHLASREPIRLDGSNIVRQIGDKVILDDVSLTVLPGEFVALVGGSGAGKSTLMEILSGSQSVDNKGLILVNGQHLSHTFEANRAKMGYVPQNDTLHLNLTVEKALQYTAQLRLPTTPPKDIEERVQEVIEMVKLGEKKSVLIKDLSGGQRKRVSIASEFISKPSLIFLDEPTSGLDPDLDKMLMEDILKEQAKEGCTILLTTHNTNNILENCTLVAFMAHGRLIYYGPPKDAPNFFNVPNFDDIYGKVKELKEALKKKEAFEKSEYHKTYVKERKLLALLPDGKTAGVSQKSSVPPHANQKPAPEMKNISLPSRQDVEVFLKQFWVLTQRHLNLLRHDRFSLLVLILAMPLISVILSAIAEPSALIGKGSNWDQILQNTRLYNPGGEAQKFLFMISLSVVLLGLFASSYEIVKESAIYRRERMINLEIAPYVCSKIFVLTLFGLIQVKALLVIVGWTVDFPGFEPERLLFWSSKTEIYITLLLAMVASICMGLAISAFASWRSGRDAVIYIILVLLIAQIVFSGALFTLPKQVEWMRYAMPTRWSLQTLGAIVDVDTLQGQSHVKVRDGGDEYIRSMQVDLGITYAGNLNDENGNLKSKFQSKLDQKTKENVEYSTALQEIMKQDRQAALLGGWLFLCIFIAFFTWMTIYLLKKQDPAYLLKQKDVK